MCIRDSQDSDSILSDPASHRHPGKYPVHESNTLSDSIINIQVIVQGLGHGDDKIPHIAQVLKNDDNELVRHEAAFSLGQMSYSSAIPPLIDSTLNDPSMFVRHEAAIALGVVGNKEAKETLQKALNDPDKPVVESAVVALSNIEFMETLSKNEKFAKLTGG